MPLPFLPPALSPSLTHPPARPPAALSAKGGYQGVGHVVRETLRTDAPLRADVLRWLVREGFPRASLDDLDFPGLARITLRHPERTAAAGATSPGEAAHPPPPVAAPWTFIGFFTGTARVSRPTVVHWATSRQRAALWAGRLVRSRRWLWAPVLLVAGLALWRWLAHR